LVIKDGISLKLKIQNSKNFIFGQNIKNFNMFGQNFVKYVKICLNSIRNIEKNVLKKIFFGQKFNFLAHSVGWIGPKIII
jgi:hypothetical protein